MTSVRSLLTGAAIMVATTVQAADTSVIQTLKSTPELSTLVSALETTGLLDTVAAQSPITIFAPTNDAFDALPEGTLNVLLMPENAGQLAEILQYHMDDRRLTSWHMLDAPTYYQPVLADTRLCIDKGDQITIRDGSDAITTVTRQDIRGPNGIVHIVDKVLIPAESPDCT